MHKISDECKFLLFNICVSSILLGFWFSIIGIYDQDKKSQTNTNPFLNPQKNVTYFELAKQLDFKSFWNWKYETSINGENYELIQACPTVKHDVYLKRNGILQLRSDGKIFSTDSRINLYNNHGDLIYVITTGNFWITVLNSNKVLVNFQVQDAFGNTLMYVESVNAWNVARTYTFKDYNGNVIADASKDITDFPWTWKADLYQNTIRSNTTYTADPGLLMIIFAYSSFSENNKKTDICNNYFWNVCIVDGIFTSLYIILLCYIFKDIFIKLFTSMKVCIKQKCNKVHQEKPPKDVFPNEVL
jgi:uncharacterized protein YxjI